MEILFNSAVSYFFERSEKFSAEEEIWHLQTWINLVSHWNQLLIVLEGSSDHLLLVYVKIYWTSKEILSKMGTEKKTGTLESLILSTSDSWKKNDLDIWKLTSFNTA